MADAIIDKPQAPARSGNTYTVEILANRFGAAFGNAAFNALLGGFRVDPKLPAAPSPGTSNLSLPTPYLEDDVVEQSKMGTPFFDKFIFRNGTKSYQFEIPPMVDLSMGKRVTTTKINNAIVDGREIGGGEVIESMGNEAWDITFRGLLIDMDNHRRPLDQMRDLKDIVRINDVLDCRDSKVFNALGIDRIYIKSNGLKFPPLEGYQDTQPFIIEARSYVPVELEIRA